MYLMMAQPPLEQCPPVRLLFPSPLLFALPNSLHAHFFRCSGRAGAGLPHAGRPRLTRRPQSHESASPHPLSPASLSWCLPGLFCHRTPTPSYRVRDDIRRAAAEKPLPLAGAAGAPAPSGLRAVFPRSAHLYVASVNRIQQWEERLQTAAVWAWMFREGIAGWYG